MTCKKISKDTISLKKEKCKKKCRKCGKVQKTLEGGYNCSIIFLSDFFGVKYAGNTRRK